MNFVATRSVLNEIQLEMIREPFMWRSEDDSFRK
jgi:hypothetical protein